MHEIKLASVPMIFRPIPLHQWPENAGVLRHEHLRGSSPWSIIPFETKIAGAPVNKKTG